MEQLSEQQLTQWAKELAATRFHQPFRHTVRYNRRLRTTAGRYMLASHVIELNPRYVTLGTKDEVAGILLHELCHYYLHLAKMGYHHRDRDFRQLLAQVGGLHYAPSAIAEKIRKQQKKPRHLRKKRL